MVYNVQLVEHAEAQIKKLRVKLQKVHLRIICSKTFLCFKHSCTVPSIKGSKGESAQHGGGKTSELLCNKHAMYRVLSQEVKR